MKITKLIKQYGEYGNEYSLTEVGDTLNELLEAIKDWEGMEIVEPTPVVEEMAEVEIPAVMEDDKGGWVARSPSSGDKVYYILNKEKRWVRNPETLEKLGFSFGSVKRITNEEMEEFDTGDDLNLSEEKEESLEVPEKEDQKKNDGDWDKYNL